MYQDELFKNSQQDTMEETSTMLESEIEANDASENIGEVVIGVVTNCVKLNVREKPRADAVVVCEVNCQTELMIDETESTEEFFKVFTSAGMEGFCMNKFITVQP